MKNILLIFYILLVWTPKEASAQVRSCYGIFKQTQGTAHLKTIDELLLHIYSIQQTAPHRINDLTEMGISPQIVSGVIRIFDTLKQLQSSNAELTELNRILTSSSTSNADIADYQSWQSETQQHARSLRKEYESQKEKLINFIKVHNAYPKFNGVTVDIVHIEGPNQSEIFINKVKSIYEAYATEKGWLIESLTDKPNHAKLLIHSPQALAHLIGENGIHSWNTVHSEFGTNGANLRADGGRKEKRRMAKVRVDILPHIAFSYKMNINDVTIDQYNSATGKGGQKRNKTSSDIRATHVPSGIVVEAKESRVAAENRSKAIEILKTKVEEFYLQEHQNIIRESFQAIQASDGSQVTRAYHLKENSITGRDATKVATRSKTMGTLNPEDVFPSIRANANASFDASNMERIDNALGRVLSIQREILDELNGEAFQEILIDAHALIQMSLNE